MRRILKSPILLLLTLGCAHSPRTPMSDSSGRLELQRAAREADAGPLLFQGSSYEPHQQSVPLNILTYNVHLLPDIAAGVAGKRSESEYRAHAIARQLGKYDLVGLCEAFDREYTQTLINKVQADSATPFQVVQGPKRSGRHLVDGGLLLLSRFPIEASHTHTFKNTTRFITSGFKADGFAAKGALHARIRIGDDPLAVLDCFLTHLESRSSSVRTRQIDELRAFIAEHANSENPIVVLGDFNVVSDAARPLGSTRETPYQRLRSRLTHNGTRLVDAAAMFERARGGTSDAMVPTGGNRIDYIFVSDTKATRDAHLEPQDARTLPLLDDRVPEGSLSDHLAVACRAEFHWLVKQANHH